MALHTSETDFDLKSIEEQVENPMLTRLNSIKGKGRLSVVTPTENAADTQFLVFRQPTKAQERTRKRQQPVKLEPLVSSKNQHVTHFWLQRKLQNCFGGMEYFETLNKKK